MRRIELLVIASLCCSASADEQPIQKTTLARIEWPGTNGLAPAIMLRNELQDWFVNIDFKPETELPRETWLKITNRVGSKLVLWDSNEVEIVPTDTNTLAVTNLPRESTVADATLGIPKRRRGLQWLRLEPGSFDFATAFRLSEVFGITFTNDYVLQVTPLLYRTQTNDRVRLVEFPPIKLKLLSNGKVEKVE
jgi:hypothetical protein